MSFVDYYAILGIDPAASRDDLRQAYRLAARRFHPDVNKATGSSALFRDINKAYEVLNDPAGRTEYDQLWHDYAITTPSLNVETIFSRKYLRPITEPQLLYVLVKIQPLLEMSMTTDAPLNLCLVVDRSTSMKGARIQHVKSAVHRIIDDSAAEDYLSVVAFSDNADVLIPAQHPVDPRSIKSVVSIMRADGATAILAGLQSGLAQIKRNLQPKYVNHIVLITDGRTYGDEEDCLTLADEARDLGIGISAMGIGEDWNDRFLDALASRTGGASAYINSAAAVSRFLQERVRSLATAYAERTELIVGPVPGANIKAIIRTSPDPMNMESDHQPIPLGSLDGKLGTKLLVQFHLNTGETTDEDFYVGRIDVSGQVLGSAHREERIIKDLVVKVTNQPIEEDPPPELLDALSRLALYRLQDRAREAVEEGDIVEATRKLEFLATRLFENGEKNLGQAALHEAQRVAQTQRFSEEGIKQLKYGTRAFLPVLGDRND
jgi:Ca-activated chloride channel family protein